MSSDIATEFIPSYFKVGPPGFELGTDRCLREPYEPVALTELPVLSTLSYGPAFHWFETRWF